MTSLTEDKLTFEHFAMAVMDATERTAAELVKACEVIARQGEQISLLTDRLKSLEVEFARHGHG